jgi:hypothetical protein
MFFAGLEDRLDALAGRREMGAAAGFVFAAGAHDRRVEVGELGFEVLAAKVFVADQDQHLAGLACAARDHLQADQFLVDLWRGQRERSGRAVQGGQRATESPRSGGNGSRSSRSRRRSRARQRGWTSRRA